MRLDCHVHLVGDGSSGDGRAFLLRTPWNRLQARFLLREAGVPTLCLQGGLDAAFDTALMGHINGSGLDGAVILAQDLPHDEQGCPLPMAGFRVPNDAVLAFCRRDPARLIPAVSIHPSRPDAMDELERCVALGARVLKLLPNCHAADCSAPRYAAFWAACARLRIAFLAHTGGELTLPVLRPDLESPKVLMLPLEQGVTCIAAHGASRSLPWGQDHLGDLIGLARRFPHLLIDNSALASPIRSAAIPRLMGELADRIVHGSDFPVPSDPVWPWLRGQLAWSDARAIRGLSNPLARDAETKRRLGFGEASFSRLANRMGWKAPS